MPSNSSLNNWDFANVGSIVNQFAISALIKTQAQLNATISAGTTGFYLIGFYGATHASLPGVAHGDVIRVRGVNQAEIFITFDQSPPAINWVSSGVYNGVFVKTGDSVHRWAVHCGVTTFSNTNLTISNYSASTILQIGTLSAERTVTLPAASSTPIGYGLTIIDASNTASTSAAIKIVAAGSNTINNNSSLSMPLFISQPSGRVDLVCDGNNNWVAVESRRLSTAIVQFAQQTITTTGNLSFSANITSNNNVSTGSGYITGGGSGTNNFTVGAGRWRVISNFGAKSGSNGAVYTALVGPTNVDLGPAWANGFTMSAGRATDISTNINSWNEFTVAPGATQQCFFRIWNVSGSVVVGSESFLMVQQLA
jgi:hypothetical protein